MRIAIIFITITLFKSSLFAQSKMFLNKIEDNNFLCKNTISINKHSTNFFNDKKKIFFTDFETAKTNNFSNYNICSFSDKNNRKFDRINLNLKYNNSDVGEILARILVISLGAGAIAGGIYFLGEADYYFIGNGDSPAKGMGYLTLGIVGIGGGIGLIGAGLSDD